MAIKRITIKSVETLGEGKNKETGNPWTRRKVHCSGDSEMDWFISFDDSYANSEGQQMEDNFSYNDKYRNWQTTTPAKEKKENEHDEIMNGLRKVYDIVNDVKGLITPNTAQDKEPTEEQVNRFHNPEVANTEDIK